MRRIKKACYTAYLTLFVMVLCTTTVSATYIDPATTAMLTQIVAGVFITLGVTFGIFRRKIIMFFKNLSVKRTQKRIERQNKSK